MVEDEFRFCNILAVLFVNVKGMKEVVMDIISVMLIINVINEVIECLLINYMFWFYVISMVYLCEWYNSIIIFTIFFSTSTFDFFNDYLRNL